MGPLLCLDPKAGTDYLVISFCQRSLQMRPLLRLGPNVITDSTFTTLGCQCHCRGDVYYAWVQRLFQIRPLLRLGPNVIMGGTFITLG